MTDKQIIIDGKACRYWFRLNPDDYRKCSLRGKDDNCAEIKDCFVKELLGKLARKEQECNKLYIQLKADEEYHKEEENTLRKIIKNKEERNIELYKENNKLKQTLTEIKKIAERNYKTKEELFKIRHSRLTKFSMGALNGRHNLASEILQKISECEVNNDMENN